jgi:carboxyl-terminal processing protease
MLKRINLALLFTLVFGMIVFMGLGYAFGRAAADTDSDGSSLLASARRKPINDLINKAFAQLDTQYFKDLKEETKQEMVYAALQGMLTPLRKEPYKDDFTNFYDPKFYKNLEAETTGNYAGIGILMGVTIDGLYPEVNTVFKNTPAEESGLLVDDIITQVGEEDTQGMILPEVAQRIKGEPGTSVKVKIFRPGDSQILDLEIERRNVEFSSVSDTQMLEGGVGYVKVSNFAEDTGADFRKSLEELSAQGMKSIVIDLRDNPGGLLDAAVQMADAFVKEGPIVKVEFRGEETADQVLEADPKTKKYDIPVVVMLNANSASASEVLASALRDYGVAKVVGEKSFGKGVVQAVVPMETELRDVTGPDGQMLRQQVPKSALAIVIGNYYTPEHKEIHGVGIEPDIWFDAQNEIIVDPKLKAYEDQLKAKRDEMIRIRSEASRYLREHDLARGKAGEIAAKLGRGETVPNEPKVEPEKEESLLLAGSARSDDEEEEKADVAEISSEK